jgi:hypothetical protein
MLDQAIKILQRFAFSAIRTGVALKLFTLTLFTLTLFTWLGVCVCISNAEEPNGHGSAQSVPRWPYEWQEDEYCFHADYDVAAKTEFFKEMKQLRADLSEKLGVRIQPEVVHIVLFREASNYREYLNQYFPDLPGRRAMYIKRRGPGMVFAYENKELDVDLRHETTHAILNASLAFLPLWLDEGIAEYFEVPPADRYDRNAYLRGIRFRVLLGHVPDITTLENVGDLGNMTPGHYRDAWSWVHFLLHESDQSRATLERFLEDIQSGFPPGPLSRRIAAELPDYKDRYLKHFRTIH